MNLINLKKHLPIIKCECGTEIQLIPDLTSMSNAIETHVAEHRNIESNPLKAEAIAKRIEEFLIVQILKRAASANR